MIVRSNFPKKVRIVEVGPRDGLQNEKQVIETCDKENLIRLLAKAGHQSIEVTSFVRPDKVKQMSDASELYPKVKDLEGGSALPCLVPNMKGLENALKLGVKEIAVFTAASDTFNHKNTNVTISQSFDRIKPVIELALKENIKVRGYVSTAFGCPYEGSVNKNVVYKVASKLRDFGCYEISLGDTIGSGTPITVSAVLDLFDNVSDIALHFHDTRGMALANVMCGLSYGVSVFDASAGGLGGCPYAKGATGNLATEDLVYLCESLGIKTGIDLAAQVDASEFILKKLNKKTTSKFLQAYLNGERNIFIPY
jgi:hydroxymethylglutaryl-CoA lyase